MYNWNCERTRKSASFGVNFKEKNVHIITKDFLQNILNVFFKMLVMLSVIRNPNIWARTILLFIIF